MSQLDIFSILIGLTPVIIVAGAALVVWREQQRVRRVIPRLPCLRGAVACGLTYRAPGPTHALLGRDCFAASAATRLP